MGIVDGVCCRQGIPSCYGALFLDGTLIDFKLIEVYGNRKGENVRAQEYQTWCFDMKVCPSFVSIFRTSALTLMPHRN